MNEKHGQEFDQPDRHPGEQMTNTYRDRLQASMQNPDEVAPLWDYPVRGGSPGRLFVRPHGLSALRHRGGQPSVSHVAKRDARFYFAKLFPETVDCTARAGSSLMGLRTRRLA